MMKGKHPLIMSVGNCDLKKIKIIFMLLNTKNQDLRLKKGLHWVKIRLKRIESKIAREDASKTHNTSKTQNTFKTQNTSYTQNLIQLYQFMPDMTCLDMF